jgi:hypothetical protein
MIEVPLMKLRLTSRLIARLVASDITARGDVATVFLFRSATRGRGELLWLLLLGDVLGKGEDDIHKRGDNDMDRSAEGGEGPAVAPCP